MPGTLLFHIARRSTVPKWRLLAVALIVTLPGCGRRASHLDGSTRAIIAGATKVEVFRIDGNEQKAGTDGERRIGGFLVLTQEQDQGKEFAQRLAEVVLNEEAYTEESAKCFLPGVVFRAWKGPECVDVVICFKCDNFYCGSPKPYVTENASFSGSPLRPQLVRLAKEAFPGDKEIQDLEEK
jgi:hypothetical protein